MISLNLLPDIKKEYLRSQRTKRLFLLGSFLVTGAFVAVTVLLGTFVLAGQNTHKNRVQNDIDEALNRLQSEENLEKIVTIQNQLNVLPGLHDGKPDTGRLFGYLKEIVPNNIALNQLEVKFEDDNEFIIAGKGENPKAVNVFVDTMKNASYTYNGEETVNAFSGVVLENISVDSEEGTSFEIVLTFDELLFDNTVTDGKLSVPKITTSTSVKERPTLFQETEEEGAE